MSPDLFRFTYLSLSVSAAGIIVWKSRRSKEDLAVVGLMTFILFAIFFAIYHDSGKENMSDDISEFMFRAFTHVKGDLILITCSSLLWGAVPFSIGIILNKKHHGKWYVCGLFAALIAIKTKFEDYYFIHHAKIRSDAQLDPLAGEKKRGAPLCDPYRTGVEAGIDLYCQALSNLRN